MLSNFISIRFLSIFFVLLLTITFTKAAYFQLFAAILFSHYFLSFVFSKSQIKNIVRDKALWAKAFLLIGLTLLYFSNQLYIKFLIPFIGIHIALSETYMFNLWHLKSVKEEQMGLINLSRFLVNISLFGLLVYGLNFTPDYFLLTLSFYALSLIFFLYITFFKTNATKNDFTTVVFFEVIGVVFVIATLFLQIKISHQHFVFYHITTWLIYPFLDFKNKGKTPELNKLLWLSSISTIFFWVIQSQPLLGEYRIDLSPHIAFWATLHFTSTFALSRLNPNIIKQHFYRTT